MCRHSKESEQTSFFKSNESAELEQGSEREEHLVREEQFLVFIHQRRRCQRIERRLAAEAEVAGELGHSDEESDLCVESARRETAGYEGRLAQKCRGESDEL